jgi:4-hydroxy-tetrahydrodipicolinate synthase
MVAMVTPMVAGVAPDTGLDRDSLARLVEFHIENGTSAIVAVGTTGESATLNEAEHCEVIRQVVEMARGRIPVIGGTGSNSTLEAISLTRCAREAGVDACLLVTPYYNKPTQEGLFLHHQAVAEAVDIPQILYNVPGRTACDMQPETVARLARIPNIIGIKEATGDLERLRRIRKLCGDKFLLLSGDDATACEFMLQGGNGVISVTANVAPRAMSDMCSQALAHDTGAARAANKILEHLHRALFLQSNPIPVKWAAHRLGLIATGIRLPMTWMSVEYEQELMASMQTAGIV